MRSLHEACASEYRIRCTRHVCTVASGNAASTASGNPFSPSTTTIKTSRTPRDFNSFITRSQNFAPSCDAVHSPRISL